MKNCFSLEQVFSYLENLLPAEERRQFELHLSACPKCRDLVEDRRLFITAAESLPDLEAPPDFDRRVLDRIFEAKVSLKSWLIAAGIWLASVMTALAFVSSSTGEQGTSFLIGMNQWFWTMMKDAGLLAARMMRIASFISVFIRQTLTFLVKGAMQFATILGPTIQLASVALTALILVGLFIGIKKGFLIGERP